MTQRADRVLTVAGALAVLVYFFAFTWRGIFIGYMPDDLMNCARARAEPLSALLRDSIVWFLPTATYRPFGGLVYWLSHEWFGVWMLPMRLLVYALLLTSLWLLWRAARLSGASNETGVLACLLWSYHYGFYALYFNNGTIYDVLCSFFSLLILVLYIEPRAADRPISWRRTALIAVLYALALSSKEPAVAVPPLLLAWEVIVKREWRFPHRVIAALMAMTLPWLYTHLFYKGALASMEAYRPGYSWRQFNGTFRAYMSELLDRPMAVDPGFAYALLLLLLVIGLRFGSRPILFGLAFFGVAYLPLAFVGARSPYAIHLSVAGLALALAASLELIACGLCAGRFEIPRRVALQGLVLYAIVLFNTRPNLFNIKWMNTEARLIREYWDALARARLSVPENGKILLLDDPLRQWEWASTFAAQLHYRDVSLMVVGEDRVPALLEPVREWDQIWRWRDGALECVKCGSAAAPAK